jgi:hypothetical protein
MRASTGLALAALLLPACAHREPTLTSPTTHVVPGATSRDPSGPPCRLTVTSTAGCAPDEVEAMIAPIRPRIERCRAHGGGKIHVRVQKAPSGKLAFDVLPGSSLDPTEKKCVLEALSALNADESATGWSASNVRPTGFTSQVTIEW